MITATLQPAALPAPPRTHPPDVAGEVRVGRHVGEAERAVGGEVKETLVESRGEEADRRPTVNQGEGQQAADVEVQVLAQSCTKTPGQSEGSGELRLRFIITKLLRGLTSQDKRSLH